MKSATGEIKDYLGYNGVFWYPKKKGIDNLVSAFSSRIGYLYYNHEATRIDLKNKKIYFKNGSFHRYDCLVSTIPLVELIHMLEGVNEDIIRLSKRLKWNSIFNLNLGIKKSSISSQHWIYFPEKEFIFFRIGFPYNFSDYLVPKDMSSLYVEVSYPAFKKIDENRLIEKILGSLKKIRIIKSRNDIAVLDYNKINYAYVIYTLDYKKILNKIFRFLKKHNIYSIGRYGGWRYATMEDCILEGKITAEKILDVYGGYN